jgi:hypothetical protein
MRLTTGWIAMINLWRPLGLRKTTLLRPSGRHNSRRGAGTAFELNETLFVHICREHTEQLLESTSRWHVCADRQTWADILPLNWWEVVHFIRHRLTVIQVIHGLSEWVAVRIRTNLRKVSCNLALVNWNSWEWLLNKGTTDTHVVRVQMVRLARCVGDWIDDGHAGYWCGGILFVA